MVREKDKDTPQRAYIENAESHLASAKVLMSAGHHDHASFHLITALEELSRGFVEQLAGSGAFRGLKWDGKSILGQVSGARKAHDFKIPGGLLLVTLKATKLYDLEIQKVSPSVPPEGRAKLVESLRRDIEWFAHLLGTVADVRELSIYAGWDRTDIPRPAVDWQRVAKILAPLVERELRFQEFLLQLPADSKVFAEARAEFIAISEKRMKGTE